MFDPKHAEKLKIKQPIIRKSTILDLLIRARDLIADKKRWCQGAVAKRTNSFGTLVVADPKSDDAEKFCAIGATQHVVGSCRGVRSASLQNRLDKAAYALHGYSIYCAWQVNDQLGHASTLKMFDKAIADEKIRRGII